MAIEKSDKTGQHKQSTKRQHLHPKTLFLHISRKTRTIITVPNCFKMSSYSISIFLNHYHLLAKNFFPSIGFCSEGSFYIYRIISFYLCLFLIPANTVPSIVAVILMNFLIFLSPDIAALLLVVSNFGTKKSIPLNYFSRFYFIIWFNMRTRFIIAPAFTCTHSSSTAS